MPEALRVIYWLSSTGNSPVEKFVDSLSPKQQAKILRIFQLLEKYGIASVKSHIKKISSSPLWEIRILGKDNIRVLYVVADKNTLVVLHGFLKKKQKTPKKELNLALERWQEWQA